MVGKFLFNLLIISSILVCVYAQTIPYPPKLNGDQGDAKALDLYLSGVTSEINTLASKTGATITIIYLKNLTTSGSMVFQNGILVSGT